MRAAAHHIVSNWEKENQVVNAPRSGALKNFRSASYSTHQPGAPGQDSTYQSAWLETPCDNTTSMYGSVDESLRSMRPRGRGGSSGLESTRTTRASVEERCLRRRGFSPDRFWGSATNFELQYLAPASVG